MKAGIERIADERRRQLDAHGWDDDHDDCHDRGQLAKAAACYAAPSRIYEEHRFANRIAFCDPWPWERHEDARPINPNIDQRIRLLEKAGALIAAEIDRLLRTKPKTEAGDG